MVHWSRAAGWGEQSCNLVCGPEGRSCAQKQPESKAGIKEDQQAQRTRDPPSGHILPDELGYG